MPQTQDYMLLGYGVAFVIFALLVGSLWWRYRSLMADQAALEQLTEEVEATPAKASEVVHA